MKLQYVVCAVFLGLAACGSNSGGGGGGGGGDSDATDSDPVDTDDDTSTDSDPVTCTQGDTRCAPGDNAIETFQADGSWANRQPCIGMTCKNGECVGVCAPNSTSCCTENAAHQISCSNNRVTEGCFGANCQDSSGGEAIIAIGIAACNTDGELYMMTACPDCLTSSDFQVAHCEACAAGPTCAVMDGCALNCE